MSQAVLSKESGFSNRQRIFSYLLLAAYLLAVYFLRDLNREASITAFSGLFFGYILQRSRFCFAAGFRDIFMIRNTALTRAILLLLLFNSLGFFLVHLLKGGLLPAGGIIYPVGIHTAVGGILFGIGLVVAGNCVSGCLMRMGEGYLMQWITFSGILVGSALGAWHLGWWGPFSIERSFTFFLPDFFGWLVVLSGYMVILPLLYYLALVYERGSFKINQPNAKKVFKPANIIRELQEMLLKGKNWSYTFGAAAIALVNMFTFYTWGKPGAITSGLTHLAGWLSCRIGFLPCNWYYFEKLAFLESRRIYLEHPLLYLSGGIVLGAFLASLFQCEFRIRWPKTYRFVISALIGGILLGYSSRVAMGCNFGGFLGGISSFSLHGWVFGLFILAGAYLGGKIFMRYLI